jgi:hypothetical protein
VIMHAGGMGVAGKTPQSFLAVHNGGPVIVPTLVEEPFARPRDPRLISDKVERTVLGRTPHSAVMPGHRREEFYSFGKLRARIW